MIRSLRWRLQVWHAIVLAAVLAIFGGIVYQLHWQTRLQQADAELDRTAQILMSRVRRLYPPPTWWQAIPNWQGQRGAGGLNSERRPRADWPDDGAAIAELPDPLRPPRNWPGKPNSSGEPRPRPESPDESAVAETPNATQRPPRNWTRPAGLGLPEDFAQLFAGDESTRLYFVIWDRDGRVLEKSASAPEIEFPDLEPRANDLPAQEVRSRGELREVIHASRYGTNVLVGRSIRRDLHAQRTWGLALLGVGGGMLAAGLLGGWWFTARSVRPIAAMARTAESISARNLSGRIDVSETDSELGRLAEVLNGMFDRLQAAFERQTRFTADASHELRTPLAVILSHTELALARPRSDDEYREALETCRRSSRRMKSLIDKLLSLARYDAGESAVAPELVDLAPIIAECVDLVRPLARERNIEIDCQSIPAVVRGDRERLSQAATNLLSNAIRYNRDGGSIVASVRIEGGTAVLTVSDTGVGIPPEHLPHVFERFYRVDKARSRAEGGSGLGLAICRTIVEAHGGTISARSAVGEGTTFEVRLPLGPRSLRTEAAEAPDESPALEATAAGP